MQPEKRARRQEQFRRFDAYLERLYREHRIRFNLIGLAVALLICGLAWGLFELLHWIANLL